MCDSEDQNPRTFVVMHRVLRMSGVLFVLGALLGALLAVPVSNWLAAAAPATIRRLPYETSDRVEQALLWALWAGILLAAAPAVAMFAGRVSRSKRLLVVLVAVALMVPLAFIAGLRSYVFAEAPRSGTVPLLRITDISFFLPAMCGIVVMTIFAFLARLFFRDRNA